MGHSKSTIAQICQFLTDPLPLWANVLFEWPHIRPITNIFGLLSVYHIFLLSLKVASANASANGFKTEVTTCKTSKTFDSNSKFKAQAGKNGVAKKCVYTNFTDIKLLKQIIRC